MRRDWVRDLLIWTLFVAVVAALGAVTLHFGCRLSWSELAVPVACFMFLQIAFYAGVVLVRKGRKTRLFVSLVALWLWANGLLFGHYAMRWELVRGLTKHDVWIFSAEVGVIALAGALVPRRWIERMGEIKCARCGHYHEGRDCTCGCQADQFKYPSFQPPS